MLSEDSDHCMDVQADLNNYWIHMSKSMFSNMVDHINLLTAEFAKSALNVNIKEHTGVFIRNKYNEPCHEKICLWGIAEINLPT